MHELDKFELNIVSRVRHLIRSMLLLGISPHVYFMYIVCNVEISSSLFYSLLSVVGDDYFDYIEEEGYYQSSLDVEVDMGEMVGVLNVYYFVRVVEDGVSEDGDMLMSDYLWYNVVIGMPDEIVQDCYKSVYN